MADDFITESTNPEQIEFYFVFSEYTIYYEGK
jgi:hypothetical protein